MPIHQKIVHFHHCIAESESQEITFTFLDQSYSLSLSHPDFDQGKVVVIENLLKHPIETSLLVWLSIYFGEDFINPSQQEDTRNSHNRGVFKFDAPALDRFLKAGARCEKRSYPIWKKRLLDNAINYYCVGVRGGISMMPLTIGFFGMSMECLGNFVSGTPKKYFKLGNFAFNKLVNTRFSRLKKSEKHRENIKKWQSFISSDSKLILAFRNACYGHSLLHLKEDRLALVRELKSWLHRSGYDDKQADFWIKPDRLEFDIQMLAPPIYKVGLRNCRILLFMLLGYSTGIPFAKYDYDSMTLIPDGTTLKFDGMSITMSKSATIRDSSDLSPPHP